MKYKMFSTKILLCLILLTICQFWVFILPVHGLSYEVTYTIDHGYTQNVNSYLDPGDQWKITWNVISGSGINVFIEDPAAVLLYTAAASSSGSYTITATINGTYNADFYNYNAEQVQIHIKVEDIGAGVPGFDFLIVLSLLGLLTLFIYRKANPFKI